MSDTNKFTIQEQIRLVNGATFFGTGELPEKDITRLQMLDGGTGINFEQLFGDFLSVSGREGIGGDAIRNVLKYFYTPEKLSDDESKELYEWILEKLSARFPAMTPPGCYPPGILLGATWNPEVIRAVGEALGEEAGAYGINVLLGTPNVNIHRDIRNGRLFEGYSEDPCLAAGLAPALVQGVQAKGVAANVKHFAANHQETNRMNIDEHIPKRALHELYYPSFKACVEAGVATVMSAYNQINGVPCTENREMLSELLRDDWGFEGVVMSDWNAVYHPAAAINAGNDLAMPGPIGPEALTKAAEEGSLNLTCLAESAARVEKLVRTYARPAEGEINLSKTDKAAYDAAAEGIVLLKNEAAILPLSSSSKIALYGKFAEDLLTCGEGSAGILTNRNVSFRKALEERFAEVTLQRLAEDTDALIYVYSLPGQEGNDRKEIFIPKAVTDEWEHLLAEADDRGIKKVLVLNVSGPVALDMWEKRFDGIFCCFLPGMQGANALADCLVGTVNPSGKLPLSWPKRLEDMPTYLNFPGDGMQVQYGEGIFVGYRWYDARKIAPMYPFGYGLSYTEFSIESVVAVQERFTEEVTVNVTVKNTGARAGKTVVQLYVSDMESTLTKPVKELKAFRKVHLEPRESKIVSFTLGRHAFESYDPNLHTWTMEEGYYRISAGFSSNCMEGSCTVYADVESPYSYGANTSVKVLMEEVRLQETVKSFFAEKKLPWALMLTSYQYTAQDTIGQILETAGCTEADKRDLYGRLRLVEKR